jgi:hypothetical protein
MAPQPPYRTLANSPLWPPNPSNQDAASPGPQPQDVKNPTPPPPAKKVPPPPVQSNTQDNFTHHSSPAPGNVQTPYSKTVPQNTTKKITKMPDVPMHITKHPNPVGRPKNRNYD